MTTSVPLTSLAAKRSWSLRWRGTSGWFGVVERSPIAHCRAPAIVEDVAVVEQGGVRGEALLAHELLVVELPTLPAPRRATVLGVPLGRDAALLLVVRHRSTSSWSQVFGGRCPSWCLGWAAPPTATLVACRA